MQIAFAFEWVIAVLLLSMRLVPLFSFAPPFTLLNIPLRVRLLIPLLLAVCLVQAPGVRLPDFGPGLADFIVMAFGEAMIGLGIAFAFQAAFGALYFAGRVLDFQAGFGLALIFDPGSRSQSPLLGTFFAFGGAAMFFAMDGHHELLRLIAASLQVVPLGAMAMGWPFEAVVAHFGVVFVIGVATAGAAMVVLFLTDLTLGYLTRTMPQMNVLLLGLQVKTLVLIMTLLMTSGLLATQFLRAAESALRFIAAMER